MTRRFLTATDDEILEGRTTDVYFQRTRGILEARDLADTHVVAEFTAGSLPRGWPWAVLAGLDAALAHLEGKPVTVRAMPEGTLLRPRTPDGVRVPVLEIEGPYGAFCVDETPLLGYLCQASGVATAAARVRRAAGDVPVLSFGVRRMHPAISPVIDRACVLGGVDGVSCILAADRLGLEPQGTMPHALVIAVGDRVEAWRAYDEVLPDDVPRIALVDTYGDEVEEALMAADALGERLDGVRLDTPASRKGDLPSIVQEVRWTLDLHGHDHVDVLVSGGLDEASIPALREAGVDGLGVGTSLSNAPTVNLAMDLVEREGEPCAKRGKFSGRKHVVRCQACFQDHAVPAAGAPQDLPCPTCGGPTDPLLETVMEDGERLRETPHVEVLRERVLDQLHRYPLDELEG